MKELLKEGNVIILRAGMMVYAEIPEMFVYINTKLSSKLTSTEVEIGQVFSNCESQDDDINETIDNIVKRIAEAFDYHNVQLNDPTDVNTFVRKQLPPLPHNDLKIPEGQYLVTKTKFGGGGIGHGGQNDVYPNGHKVTCKKLDTNGNYVEDGMEVSFYQSGSFSAMIMPEKLEVIGNMKVFYTK